MRADRLLSLLLLLQTRGRMTAQELAEQLEVSERTIYRDIEALSFAGIPLYTERGPGGGCALLDGYQTRLTGLTTREVRALFLLSTAAPLTDLGLDQALEDALLKLSAALPTASRELAEQVRQRIHMDTGQSARPGISHLETLQEAIWHECLLCLTYRDKRKYLIEPYGLVTQNGTWYLIGANAGTMQVVRIAHIHAAEITEQHFTRSPAFDLATYWAEHVSRIYHAPASSRGSHSQKKAKMKAGASSPRTHGGQTALTRNKKTNFYFSRVMSGLSLLTSGRLFPQGEERREKIIVETSANGRSSPHTKEKCRSYNGRTNPKTISPPCHKQVACFDSCIRGEARERIGTRARMRAMASMGVIS